METMSWNEAKRLGEYIQVKQSLEYIITMYGVKQYKYHIKGQSKLIEWSHLLELNYVGNTKISGYTIMQRKIYY